MNEPFDTLRAALEVAASHLDYCGYGDNWERECAQEAKLEEQINAALAATSPENEKIDRVAIRYDDIGVFHLPRPARHHHVMWCRLLIDGQRTPGAAEQGFITTTGRFVGRREAFEIATRHGQIIEKHGNPELLFSEDVWETNPASLAYGITSKDDPE
jgi:hypothetical protein